MSDALRFCLCGHSRDRHLDESCRPVRLSSCADGCGCRAYQKHRPLQPEPESPPTKKELKRAAASPPKPRAPMLLPPAGETEPYGGYELGWWTR